MKLSSKQFVVPVALLAAFIFIFILIGSRYANSQSNSGTPKETKTNKATAKADAVLVTFVEIGAAKCIPCKAMQPIMKAVAEEYKGQVKVVFHDVWTSKGRDDAEKYNIRIIPTQVFLDKGGKECYRHEGFFPKDDVVRIIKLQGVK